MRVRQFGQPPPARQPALGIFQIGRNQLDRRLVALRSSNLRDKNGTETGASQVFTQEKLPINELAFPALPGFDHFTSLHHLTCLSGLLYASFCCEYRGNRTYTWEPVGHPGHQHWLAPLGKPPECTGFVDFVFPAVYMCAACKHRESQFGSAEPRHVHESFHPSVRLFPTRSAQGRCALTALRIEGRISRILEAHRS